MKPSMLRSRRMFDGRSRYCFRADARAEGKCFFNCHSMPRKQHYHPFSRSFTVAGYCMTEKNIYSFLSFL